MIFKEVQKVKSKTKQALDIMISTLKKHKGSKLRQFELRQAVESKDDFSEGHINGALNQLRKNYSDLNVNYERIDGKAYFEFINSNELKINIKQITLKKIEELSDQLIDLKKDVTNVEDFQWLQKKISQIDKIRLEGGDEND